MQNESIPDARGPVFCGVDTHADSHWLYVLDWRGRKVLSRQFPADAAGYEALAGAIAAAGEPACIAMEGTSSYGAGLNPGRLRSEASFAAICGACPIPASSGKTVRHRLNRGGDRQANSALHEIARQRVMRDPETAEYAERARGRGKSDREVMRCLKRYVAREAYRALMRPVRDQEARGRLGARGGQARGEGQPGEGGVHTGHQREVHLDAGEGPKGAQAHKEGLRGMGRGRTSARLGQASLRGRAQNGF